MYGINPVARNAIAQGRLGPLVLFALLPFLLLRVVRLGDRDDTRRGRVLRLAVLAALLGAFYPAGLALFLLAVFACVLAIPIAGRAKATLRAFGIAIVASIGALVLLFPWPLAYAHAGTDKASLGFAFRPDLDLAQVLRFDSGPASAGWVMWGLIVAAAVPLFVATGERLAWTARGWVLALVGWAAVWVPAQFFPDTSVLAPEAGLTLAALGLALCVGITVSVFVDGIHSFRFGWRQPAAILGAFAIVLPALAFTADVFDGRWDAPASGWAKDLTFTESSASKGEFRMLWAGDPAALPLDPVVLRDGTGYVLTRNGPGDVTEQWRAPEHDADHVIDRALLLAAAGRTNRLGRMLAPMGVRYVVVPSTQGRDGGAAGDAPVALRRAMAQQLDLARLRSSRGLVLYENVAYAPIRAAVSPPALPVDSRRPNRAALTTDLTRAVPLPSDGATAVGTAFWGEAYDSEWKATGNGDTLRHQEPFGWANGFVVDRRATVSIAYEAQWLRWAMLGGALVIWVLVMWRWRRTRVRRDPSTRAIAARQRRERDGEARPPRRTRRRGVLVGAGVNVDDQAPETPAPESPARRRRKVRRGPILFVVLVALVAAVVAQQRESPGASSSTAARAAAASIGVPAADVASSAWYCAAGTSTPDGNATETVVIASLAHTDIEVTVTVMPGGDAAPTADTMRLAPGEEVSVPVADVLATAEPGVVVEAFGGPAAVSHVLEHGDDIGVDSCTRTAAPDWYFASGTTVEGSQLDLVLFNPFGDDAIVDVSFATDTGTQEPAGLQALVVPRRSRVTIPVQDSVLRQTRVAAHVHARTGRVVAEQTQIFDDVVIDATARSGIALSAGATAPSTVWRIPAGTTRNDGRVQLALANLSSHDASIAVKAVVVGGADAPAQTVRVPSQGVILVDVNTRVPLDSDVAVIATARAVDGRRVPIVAELLETWPPASSTTGLASTLGSTITADRWVVPVPDVDGDVTVTVFNPGPDPVTAEVLPAADIDRRVGPTSEPELAIAPGKAKTVRLTRPGSRPIATVITANHPVVVGFTVLGNAGAAIGGAVPDLTHADLGQGG